jgi:hypothetical protein
VGKRRRRGRQERTAWLARDGGIAGDWRRRRGWLEIVALRETGDAAG